MPYNESSNFKQREKRVNDAIQLKEPDRVPFVPISGLLPTKYTGMTNEDAFYSPEKWFDANIKLTQDFEPDLCYNIGIFCSGQAFDALDCKTLLIPGHGIPADHCYQFVEKEYMLAEEYDAFLDDPSDFAIRTYLPRTYGKLKPFAMLPPLKVAMMGYGAVGITSIFTQPELREAFESLFKAGMEVIKWVEAAVKFQKKMIEAGFPMLCGDGAVTVTPFDFVSDVLRGMRGSMLDMFRHPEKLLKAMEKVAPLMVEGPIFAAKQSGNSRVFIPLHRGADGFMSKEQFETFYWPGLKKLLETLVEAGLTPWPFFEGSYDSRLEYLTELPPGKICGIFDQTDIFKAKKVIGSTMCIGGNMPPSMLMAGTPEQVEAYTRRLIDEVGRDGGFIMSSGASLDDVDPKLVQVWADATRKYGIY